MEIQKGEWYFTIRCKECDRTIYFSHDPSRGTVEIAAHEDSAINVRCPVCQVVADYDRSELFSREAENIWVR